MDGIETYWIWLVIGLALALLEMLVPGVYLIWLAMAALAIAVLAFVSAPPLALQVIAWVSLSLIFAFSARRWLRDRPIVSSDPLLNNRAGRLVGETALVTQ
ncbi:MAG: NfeD family protein, partial [Pseudomonadota bacterium]|nr:NfeD family protein [Pseudomonadota bacterium]